MSYTSYADLTIGTVAGVKSKIGSPSLALQMTQGGTDVDAAIQSALNDTKDTVLSKHLDAYFRDVMPDTIQRWTDLRMSWYHSYHRRPNLDTTALFGMFFDGGTTSSLWFASGNGQISASDFDLIARPATYFFTGPVVNSPTADATLLNVAWNGDRAYDTKNRILYVNRGSEKTNPATVNWQLQTYEDVKNYLINPSILANAHVYATCARMFELGVTRNRPNFADANAREYFTEREAYYKNKFISELYGEGDEQGRRLHAGVLKLLQHDYSDAGSYTEFSREITSEEVWVS